MDLKMFLLAFTMFWKSSSSLHCFKCIPDKLSYGIPSCSHFNYEKEFVVACDSSTMCFKRETTLDLGNGVVTKSEERGCAPQTMDGDQMKIDGSWKPVKRVYEVYEEKCEENKGDYQRATRTLDCYCRGELCNDATNISLSLGTFFTMIVWFLVS